MQECRKSGNNTTGENSQITFLTFIGQDRWRCLEISNVVISSRKQQLLQAIRDIRILVNWLLIIQRLASLFA